MNNETAATDHGIVKKNVKYDPYYVYALRRSAVKGIYAALVELLTNCVDAYKRRFEAGKRVSFGGTILVEYNTGRQKKVRGGKRTKKQVIVRDMAFGLDAEELEECFSIKGGATQYVKGRGSHGCGAKDCADISVMTIESVRDFTYYKVKLYWDHETKRLVFDPIEGFDKKVRVSAKKTKEMGLYDAGMSITMDIDPDVTLPQFDNFIDNIRDLFPLRDFVIQHASFDIKVRKDGGKEKRVTFKYPEAEELLNVEYMVPGYNVPAHFKVFRTEKPMPRADAPLLSIPGILISSNYSIHECSFLDHIDSPDLYHYYGRIECPHINVLIKETRDKTKTAENPSLVVDVGRRPRLVREHPFTKKLLAHPKKLFKEIVAQHSDKRKATINHELNERLKNAGREMRKMLDELLEYDDEVENFGPIGPDEITAMPSGNTYTIKAQHPWRFNVFAGANHFKEGGPKVEVKVELDREGKIMSPSWTSRYIEVPEVQFKKQANSSTHYANIILYGKRPTGDKDQILISVLFNGVTVVEKMVTIIADNHKFKHGVDLEFVNQSATVVYGKRRHLKLRGRLKAKPKSKQGLLTPSDKATVKIRIARIGGVSVKKKGKKGKAVDHPISYELNAVFTMKEAGSNYAEAIIPINGDELHGKAKITATVRGTTATIPIEVIKRATQDIGHSANDITFDLVSQDSDRGPAKWVSDGKVEIYALHPDISSMLGSEADGWPNQSSPFARLIIARILAWALAKRVVRERAEKIAECDMTGETHPGILVDDVDAAVEGMRKKCIEKLTDKLIPKKEQKTLW